MENRPLSQQAWPAPAKINLFLHVTGRRPDGYHELQTVFQFLDHCDDLFFAEAPRGEVRRQGDNGGIVESEDLVVRAARALQQHTGTDFGVCIRVVKRVPMGGGLGGGSSDAATTLVALNRIFDLGLSLTELATLGLALGADVPVFVGGHAAWAEGVGEKLEAIDPPERWYLVVVPHCHVDTGRVFQAPDLTRNTPAITIRDFLRGAGGNDCEKVVRRLFPPVAEVLDWLGQHYRARMTGTGACVFVDFEDHDSALQAGRELPGEWQYFVARGRNQSPLCQRLASERND